MGDVQIINVSMIRGLPAPRGSGPRTMRGGQMLGRVAPRIGAEVSGFSATMEAQVVDGLPNGINVPADTMDLIRDAQMVHQWVVTGQQVEAWCAQEGLEQHSWMSEDGTVTVPDEVLDDCPDAVRQWAMEAPEAVAALRRLRQED